MICLKNLAQSRYLENNFSAAELLLKRLIGILEPSHAQVDTDIATCFFYLAEILRRKQKYDEAEIYYLRAIDGQTKALGAEDTVVGQMLECYAKLLEETHRQESANHIRQCADTILSKNAAAATSN